MIEIKRETITLINLVTNESLVLSEENNDFILDGLPDWGSVTASISFDGYVNQLGFDKTNTSLQTRAINILGWVVAKDSSQIRERKAFLNKFVNPLQELRLIYDEYYIDFTPNYSIQYAKEYAQNNEVMCKFNISGVAGIPLWSYIKRTQIEKPPDYAAAVFPLIIPEDEGVIFGIAGEGHERNIVNKGSVDSGFILELSSKNIDIINPKISIQYKGVTSQEDAFMKVNVTVKVGEVLRVSTEYGKEAVTFVDGNGKETNIMTSLSRDSTLFALGQGLNILTIEDDSGFLELTDFKIEFSPLSLEVQ